MQGIDFIKSFDKDIELIAQKIADNLKKEPYIINLVKILETLNNSLNTGEETPIKSELKGVEKNDCSNL